MHPRASYLCAGGVKFIGDLREAIWAHYQEQLVGAYRELHASDDDKGPSSGAPLISPSPVNVARSPNVASDAHYASLFADSEE
jgi:hypothetical protein